MKNTILRILFVDDDDDVRFMVKRWLGRHSYEVSTAESMACGLQLARSEAFDLYLFDTKLADGTGQELCERVREFDQQTPIIFIRANTRRGSVRPRDWIFRIM
jgi:DNA-binding response OmpR family regulator